MVVGIFLRINVSHYALSKAIGINDRIEVICQQKGVRFLNFWDTYITNRSFFRGDEFTLARRVGQYLGIYYIEMYSARSDQPLEVMSSGSSQ